MSDALRSVEGEGSTWRIERIDFKCLSARGMLVAESDEFCRRATQEGLS